MNINSDIILLDEVLSVGDAEFAKKSKAKIKGFKDKGKAIFFLSHDPTSIMEMCNEVVRIGDGRIQIIGEPILIAAKYKEIAR